MNESSVVSRHAPPVVGADFLAALVANCLRGAFPPVDLRAVCFVRAMSSRPNEWRAREWRDPTRAFRVVRVGRRWVPRRRVV